jgi:hypothetical protein
MTKKEKQTQTITAILTEKLEKTDRYNEDYLVLKLDNNETIFVFPSKLNTSH